MDGFWLFVFQVCPSLLYSVELSNPLTFPRGSSIQVSRENRVNHERSEVDVLLFSMYKMF